MRWRQNLGAAPALLVISFALLELFSGDATPRWDAHAFYAPNQSLIADHARAGRFVLWNPWMSAGRPDAADPQVGAFSPFAIVVGLIAGGGLLGFALYWWAVWCFGAIGMWRLCVHMRAPPWAAAAVPLVFATSGFYAGHAQHTSILLAYSFVPWILWRLDIAVQAAGGDRPDWRGVCLASAQCGALWGLSALSGYPGMSVITAFLIGVWALFRLLASFASPSRQLRSLLVIGGLVLGVGVPVLAPSYWLFLSEGESYTDRDEISRNRATRSGALIPEALATFASPEVTAVKVRHNKELWAGLGNSLVSIHLGLCVMALGLAAAVTRPREPWRWALTAMALLFLSLALSRDLPVRGWLYDLLPPFRFFRHAALFRGYAMLCLLLLAVEAARDLTGDGRDHQPDAGMRRRVGWVAAAFVALLALASGPAIHGVADALGEELPSIDRAVTFALTIGFVSTVAYATMPLLRGSSLRVAGWMLAGVFAIEGVNAMIVANHQMLSHDSNLADQWQSASERRRVELGLGAEGLKRRRGTFGSNLDLVSKSPTFRNYDSFGSDIYIQWGRTPILARTVLGRDRIWFSPEALPASNDAGGFSLFKAEVERRKAPVLILNEASAPEAGADQLEALPDAVVVPASDLVYDPTHLGMTVTAPSDGWLWVTDRWTAGWRASVDGSAVELRRANFLFRAIFLSRGQHRVEFDYAPSGYPWLVVVSWSLLGLVAALSVRAWASSRGGAASRA